MEDLTGKAAGPGGSETQLTHTEWNNFFQEWVNLIEDTAGTMDVGDLDQMAQAMAHYAAEGYFYADGGAANAYTLTSLANREAVQAYFDGQTIKFRATNNNTGVSTVNVNGLGVKTIKREDGSALAANNISTDRDAEIRYDGTDFLLSEGSAGAPSQALPEGYIKGLTYHLDQTAVSSRHQKLQMMTGICRDATNTVNISITSTRVKDFNAVITVGGQGLQDNVISIGSTTWVRLFVLQKTDGTTEFGIDSVANDDASGVRAYLDSIDSVGWNYYRQVAWLRANGDQYMEQLMQSEHEPWFQYWAGGITETNVDISPSVAGNIEAMVYPSTHAPSVDEIEVEFDVVIDALNTSGMSGSPTATMEVFDYDVDTNAIAALATTYKNRHQSVLATTTPNLRGFKYHAGQDRVRLDSSRGFYMRTTLVGSTLSNWDFHLMNRGFRWNR